MIKHIEHNRNLLLLSQKCHFIGHGIQTEREMGIQFRHYIPSDQSTIFTNSQFVTALLSPESDVGLSKKDDFKIYLDFLARFGELSGVDVLVIHVSSDGRPTFIRVNSYQRLQMSLNQVASLYQNQIQNQGKDMNRGQGFGRGM